MFLLRSLASSNQAKRQQTSTAPTTSANQNQAPVFINMPFMMTPSMMPTAQFLSADGTPMVSEAQMPRLVQSYPMSTPTGVMMPQMATDTNNVQFPTLFMACGATQPRPEPQQQQTQNSEQGMILQPMMMPMRNQGSFMMMPAYPCMSPFQTPTLVPMQTSTEEQTSPSEWWPSVLEKVRGCTYPLCTRLNSILDCFKVLAGICSTSAK